MFDAAEGESTRDELENIFQDAVMNRDSVLQKPV
jgi:hypothetical protein